VTAAKHRLGALDLALISDGQVYLDAGAVFGLVPRIMWEPYAGELDDKHRMALGLNSVLVRSQGRLVLVETGVGDKPRGWRRQSSPIGDGNLLAELDALGVQPADIDVVVNTHLHADHCGWNTRYVDGVLAPSFPNAEYVVMRDEWQSAMAPDERTRATYIDENLAPLADSGQLRLIDGETRLTDAITVVPAPGHSPGHAAIVLSSGGETAVYIGDIAQAAVQLERTAWVSAFDILPLVSMATKKALVERAIEDGSLIINCHAPFPGLGRMTRTSEGYRRWQAVALE
jgi:glyoxylase-like metal-dependent hydrolase (beta-lactamase superfamily II)